MKGLKIYDEDFENLEASQITNKETNNSITDESKNDIELPLISVSENNDNK